MRSCLRMGLAVDMRMDNGRAVDNMAMKAEADIHVVKREYHNQKTAYFLSGFLCHYQLFAYRMMQKYILFPESSRFDEDNMPTCLSFDEVGMNWGNT